MVKQGSLERLRRFFQAVESGLGSSVGRQNSLRVTLREGVVALHGELADRELSLGRNGFRSQADGGEIETQRDKRERQNDIGEASDL